MDSKKSYKKRKADSAVKALARKVSRLERSTHIPKYFRQQVQSDVAGNLLLFRLNDPSQWTSIFNSSALSGKRAIHKYMDINWEIHCDSANNEEETTNHTLIVCQPSKWNDSTAVDASNLGTADYYVYQGQARMNPLRWKVLYRKHFTITMGGTAPGTAGESRKYGRMLLRTNKLLFNTGSSGLSGQTLEKNQDRIFFLWFTDNTTADTESPRINASVVHRVDDDDT